MTLDQLYTLFVERDTALKQLADSREELAATQAALAQARSSLVEIATKMTQALEEAEKERLATGETSKQATLETCAQRLDLVLTGNGTCADFDKMLAAVRKLKDDKEKQTGAGGDEIKIGDDVEVVSRKGYCTWESDMGGIGTVLRFDTVHDCSVVRLADIPGKKNVLGGYVSVCDVRKVTSAPK